MPSGYGSQALALKYLDIPFEHWKTCEWTVKSIQAYKDIHFTDAEEIDIDEAIKTINKQNKRIEELVLGIERLNNIIKDTKQVLLTSGNVEKALNVLDKSQEPKEKNNDKSIK